MARLLARAISQRCCIYHALMSLPHVWSPEFSQQLLFLLISQKRQSHVLGTRRYTGLKSLERSLRIVRSHGTFQIQRLRRKALAVGSFPSKFNIKCKGQSQRTSMVNTGPMSCEARSGGVQLSLMC